MSKHQTRSQNWPWLALCTGAPPPDAVAHVASSLSRIWQEVEKQNQVPAVLLWFTEHITQYNNSDHNLRNISATPAPFSNTERKAQKIIAEIKFHTLWLVALIIVSTRSTLWWLRMLSKIWIHPSFLMTAVTWDRDSNLLNNDKIHSRHQS